MKNLISFAVVLFLFFGSGNILDCKAEEDCCGHYSPGNPFECTTHDKEGHEGDHGNCTWWAYYGRPDVYPACHGNANEWLSQAKTGGLPTGNYPIAGSIAVFEDMSDLGHLAYVESVNPDGSFNVTEMGYNWFNCVRENEYPTESATGFILPRGDLNTDGAIDVIDLGILLSNWRSNSQPPADINQDEIVDVIDLGILLSNWGK